MVKRRRIAVSIAWVLLCGSAANAQDSGTMAGLLRRTIESLQRGSPNYSEMEPLTADGVERQAQVMQEALAKLGGITKISFRGPQSFQGTVTEAYRVSFEKGSSTWLISKGLTGKIQVIWTTGPGG